MKALVLCALACASLWEGQGCLRTAKPIPGPPPDRSERFWGPLMARCAPSAQDATVVTCPMEDFRSLLLRTVDLWEECNVSGAEADHHAQEAELAKRLCESYSRELQAQSERYQAQRWWWAGAGLVAGALCGALLISR